MIRYREHLGPLSAAFDVRIGKRIELDANWLLTWSHHVLYTNMVEPLLRFVLVDRDHVLLHCAAIDAERGAVILSAQTDTGKTSTVLRLLMAHSWGFISDDMAILTPGGEMLSYPKPMTLSSHTMAAVNDQALPRADRVMLAIPVAGPVAVMQPGNGNGPTPAAQSPEPPVIGVGGRGS